MAAHQSPEGAYQRLLLFVGLAVVFALWLNHHYGYDLIRSGGSSLLAATIAWVLNLVSSLFGKESGESLKRTLLRTVDRAATTRVLVILSCLFVIVALSRSSVSILGHGDDGQWSAHLTVLDGSGSDAATTVASEGLGRFTLWTSPFGRAFRLKVDGHISETIVVYPIVGSRLKLGRDLSVSPSLLVRPPAGSQNTLVQGGGAFLLSHADTGDTLAFARFGKRDLAAFLVGRSQPIPSSFRALWELELRAQGPQVGPRTTAHLLLAWSTPKVLTLREGLELEPQMKLDARFLSALDITVAEATVILSEDRLIDVPMVYVENTN